MSSQRSRDVVVCVDRFASAQRRVAAPDLIVVDQAARLGVRIGWAEHARIGVPITLPPLASAAAWLWLLRT